VPSQEERGGLYLNRFRHLQGGAKFFPSRIEAVNEAQDGSVTYDVKFDDGDRNRRALPENVRRMGAASASVTPDSAAASLTHRLSRAQAGDGQTLAVGDRCECRFKVKRTLSSRICFM
jgi:hypothetical protein